MPGLWERVVTRRRNRTEIRRIERENAAELGDDFRFSRDPEVAAERQQRRREIAQDRGERMRAFHQGRWTLCMVKGCEFTVPKLLNFLDGIELPLCTPHQIAVWEHVNESLDDPDISLARQAMRARRDAIALAENEERQAEEALDREDRQAWLKSPDAKGEIYYARVGGLIKVGWTSALHRRIRSYGPDTELLVHYGATRRDETNLHRQLAPSRVKGREWYHDDPIVRAFIARALREHGEPRFTEVRWTEPKQVVAGKHTHYGRSA